MSDETLIHLQEALAERFKIVRPIGRGGMATVYLAEESHPRRQVAIKVLSPEFANSLTRERFLREVEVVSQLVHPHIVPVFTAGEADGLLYYVMPYIRGESLRHRLVRERTIPTELAVEIARITAEALDYAHKKGIIHRDIKPENILLSGNDPMIADFGIARAVGSAGGPHLTQPGLSIGTPAYMSPEQWTSSGEVDARSDLYSLACVLLESLSGEPAVGTPSERRDSVAKVVDRSTGGHGIALKKAIERALDEDPRKRFQTAAEFANALGPVRTSAGRGSGFSPRQKIGLAALVAVSLVALVIAAIVLPTSGGAEIPSRVVVDVFENQTGDPTLAPLGSMAADWITQGLARTQIVQVVGTRTALASSEGAGGASAGAERARAVADEAEAGIVVWGRYYLQGDSVHFNAQITDAEEQVLLRGVGPVSGPVDSPLVAVEKLRQRVMGALASQFDDRLTPWATANTQPPPFDAYQGYIDGMTRFMQLDVAGGIRHLNRASTLDPSFVTPRLFAAFAHASQGEWRQADSLAGLIGPRRDSLTPFDRHLLDWIRAITQSGYSAGLPAVREAAASMSGAEAMMLVALTALGANRPAEAREALLQVRPDRGLMRGFFLYWAYLTETYHRLGDHDREFQAAQRGRELYPNNPLLIEDEIRALAVLGRFEEMHVRIDEREAIPPLPIASSFGGMLRVTYLELRRHGHPDAAVPVLERALRWYETYPAERGLGLPPSPPGAPRELPFEPQELIRYGHARTLYHAGELDEAQSMIASLVRERPDSIGYLGYLAAIAARRGEKDRARNISDSLTRLERPYTFGHVSYWQARIAALLGERQRALTLLNRALAEGFGLPYYYAMHLDFESLWGDPEFENVIRPKG